jgi:preprotein translocase subunit SecE
MARDRQRAKQRQAERRAARLAGTRQPDSEPGRDELLEEAELAIGAPPEDLGRSDATLEAESRAREDGELEDGELEEEEELEEEFEPELDEAADRRRQRPHEADRHGRRRHNRLLGFLIAVWAELQRVEWPNRQTLTMLTGVVVLFVIVMGAYLGVLDQIFSKIINKIL